MTRTGMLLALVAAALLLAYATLMNVYVVPVFQSLLMGLGVGFSTPAQIALGVGQWGAVLIALLAGAVAAGLWRARTHAGVATPDRILGLTQLVLVLYVVAQGFVFVDVAINIPARFTTPPAMSAPAR
jgi:type II secretory pathway component PulF